MLVGKGRQALVGACVVLLVQVSLGGCSKTETPQDSRRVVVGWAGSVPVASTSAVSTLLSGAEEVSSSPSGGSVEIPINAGDAIVFALNSDGDPLLAGYAAQGRPPLLDAESTALVLARTFLLSTFLVLPDEASVRAAIRADAAFPDLVTAVQGMLVTGRSYATSDEVIGRAEAVAFDALKSLGPWRPNLAGAAKASSTAPGPLRFDLYPVFVSSEFAGPVYTKVTIGNDTYLNLDLTMSQGDGGLISLAGKAWKLPTIGILTKDTTFYSIVNGPLSATVEFSAAEKNLLTREACIDLFSGILQAAGVAVDGGVATSIDNLVLLVDLGKAANAASLTDALKVVAGAIWDNRAAAIAEFAKHVPGPVAKVIFKILNPVRKGKLFVWTADRALHYADAATYWNAGPSTVSVCVAGGLMDPSGNCQPTPNCTSNCTNKCGGDDGCNVGRTCPDNCTNGKTCQANACACPPAAPLTCGGKCIATCPGSLTCQDSLQACGCPPGQKECNGACINDTQCCTNAECQAPTTCQSNTCACPTGQKLCNGACISASQCCTNADCKSPATCQANACACPTGQKLCNGACINDTQCCTNAECQAPTTCQANVCGCPAATPLTCGGTCIAACPGTLTCQDAIQACGCAAGQKVCNGACISDSQCCTNAECQAPATCQGDGICKTPCEVSGCTAPATCQPDGTCQGPATNHWAGTFRASTWTPAPPSGWLWEDPRASMGPTHYSEVGYFYFSDGRPEVVLGSSTAGPSTSEFVRRVFLLGWRSTDATFGYSIPTGFAVNTTGLQSGVVSSNGSRTVTFVVTNKTATRMSGTFEVKTTSGYWLNGVARAPDWTTVATTASGTWSASFVNAPPPQTKMNGSDFCQIGGYGHPQNPMDPISTGCNPSFSPWFCGSYTGGTCTFQ